MTKLTFGCREDCARGRTRWQSLVHPPVQKEARRRAALWLPWRVLGVCGWATVEFMFEWILWAVTRGWGFFEAGRGSLLITGASLSSRTSCQVRQVGNSCPQNIRTNAMKWILEPHACNSLDVSQTFGQACSLGTKLWFPQLVGRSGAVLGP